MEIVTCVAWNVWKERNEFIFEHHMPSFGCCKVRFRSDLMLHRFRIKEALDQPLLDWILSTFV
jgi:hypothetical protein